MSRPATRRTDRRAGVGVAAGLFLACAGLYLGTLSRQYSSDSCLYAFQVAAQGWSVKLAPHHLLLHPLGRIWFRLWQAVGWTGGAMWPLQVLNALGGAACVALLFSRCARLTRSAGASLVAAGGFAVSGGLWLLSTEAEFVTVPVALELLVLGWILRFGVGAAPSRARIAAVGAAIGTCMLAYLSTAVLVPVALLMLWKHGRDGRCCARDAIALLAGVAVPVLIGAAVVLAVLTPESAAHAVLRPGHGYGAPTLESLPRGFYAFLRSLVLFPGLGMSDRTVLWWQQAATMARLGWAATYLAVALLAALPLAIAWKRGARLDGGAVLAFWAALHAAFAFWWVPSDVSFWLPVTAAWWMAVAALMATAPRAHATLAVAAVGLLLFNGLGLILPHHRPRAPDAPHPCAFLGGWDGQTPL